MNDEVVKLATDEEAMERALSHIRPKEEEDIPEFGIWRGDEIYSHSSYNIPLIEGLINHRDFVVIQAEAGKGKSAFGQQMMFNLTTGQPFLDCLDIQGAKNVLWNMGESTKNKHINRLKNMKKKISVNDKNWWFHNCDRMHLNNDAKFDEFRERIASIGVKFDVMFFDSLFCFLEGSFNDDDSALKWTSNFRSLSAEYDCTMIVLHHVAKDTFHQGKKIDKGHRLFGSTFWDSFFTTTFMLTESKSGFHYLESGKDRDGDAVSKLKLKMIKSDEDSEGRMFFTQDVDEINSKAGTAQEQIQNLLKLKSPREPKELYYNKKATNDGRVPKSTFYNVIKKMEKSGIVRLDKNGTKIEKVHYLLGGVKIEDSGVEDKISKVQREIGYGQ